MSVLCATSTRLCAQDVQWVAEDGDSNYVRRRRWERRAVNVSVKPSSSIPGSIKIDKEGAGLLDRTNSNHSGGFEELLDAGMLPKKVSVNYLQTAGGGAAREGLLWKEGRGLLSNWERRYWVLWPKIPDEGAHQPKSLLLTCRRLTASLLFEQGRWAGGCCSISRTSTRRRPRASSSYHLPSPPPVVAPGPTASAPRTPPALPRRSATSTAASTRRATSAARWCARRSRR